MAFKTILCFLLIVVGSSALTCFRGTEKSWRPMHNAAYCMTVFSGEKEGVFYGGFGSAPGKHPDLEGMTTNRYCDIQHGEGSNVAYRCYCFSDYCNEPLSFNEFFRFNFGRNDVNKN